MVRRRHPSHRVPAEVAVDAVPTRDAGEQYPPVRQCPPRAPMKRHTPVMRYLLSTLVKLHPLVRLYPPRRPVKRNPPVIIPAAETGDAAPAADAREAPPVGEVVPAEDAGDAPAGEAWTAIQGRHRKPVGEAATPLRTGAWRGETS